MSRSQQRGSLESALTRMRTASHPPLRKNMQCNQQSREISRKPMTVAELKAALEGFDPDLPIVCRYEWYVTSLCGLQTGKAVHDPKNPPEWWNSPKYGDDLWKGFYHEFEDRLDDASEAVTVVYLRLLSPITQEDLPPDMAKLWQQEEEKELSEHLKAIEDAAHSMMHKKKVE